MLFLTPLDLAQNELRNVRLQNLAAAPADPVAGQVYFDTALARVRIYDGGAWVSFVPVAWLGATDGVATLDGDECVVQPPAAAQETPGAAKIPLANGAGKLANGWLHTGAGNGLDADSVDGQHAAGLLARANHTGTQPASTISDFDAQVRTSRLDQLAAPATAVGCGGQRLSNVGTPTADTDAATKGYVDGVALGLDAKPSVRAGSTGNLTLSGLQTVDGIALAAGDRVLVKNQSTAAQNGVYVAASGAWARAADADAWAELVGAFVFVEQGTAQADSGWLCTVDAGGTLGATAVSFVQFSQAGTVTGANVGTGSQLFKQKSGTELQFRTLKAGSAKATVTQETDEVSVDVAEASLTLGNLGGTLAVAKGGTGATAAAAARTNLGAVGKYAVDIGNGSATQFTVTHGLGSLDVLVQVRQAASPYAVVWPDVQGIDANSVRVLFTVAPAAGKYRVVVKGDG